MKYSYAMAVLKDTANRLRASKEAKMLGTKESTMKKVENLELAISIISEYRKENEM